MIAAKRHTFNVARASRRALHAAEMAVPHDEHPHAGHGRPATFGACDTHELGALGRDVPCPYVSCAYHLGLEVDPITGNVRVRFPSPDDPSVPDIERMAATCALRVAIDGGRTLEDTGGALDLTRERVRQIESYALANASVMLRASGVLTAADLLPGPAWCGHMVDP